MWKKIYPAIPIVGFFVALGLAQTAMGSTFKVGVSPRNFTGACSMATTEGSQISADFGNAFTASSGTAFSHAEAFSSGKGLGVLGSATGIGGQFGSAPRAASGACFASEVIFDDVIISGPGPQVTTRFTVDLTGSVQGDRDPVNGGLANCSILASVGAPGPTFGNRGQFTLAHSTADASPISQSYDTNISTTDFVVTVGEPFSVKLELSGRVWAEGNFGIGFSGPGSSNMTSDFSSTLTFRRNGPVFDLPDGYTANSVSGNIIDNQFVPGSPSSVPGESPVVAKGIESIGTYPNPFNPQTTIRFSIANEEKVDLTIYDTRGRVVTRLMQAQSLPAGEHQVSWNGTDLYGRPMGSGVYLYMVQTDTDKEVRRMVLLR